MFWYFIFFPIVGMVIIIIVAVLLGKRDRKKEAIKMEENKKNLLSSNPTQAVLQYLDNNKEISEYTFINLEISKTKYDILYISKKGIFIIYPLNNAGIINGEVNEENWLNKTHDEFVLKNPMYNNGKDIEVISNITSLQSGIYSIAVCTCASEINIIDKDEEYNVCKLEELKEVISSYPDIISENDLVIYYNNIVNASSQGE